LSAPESVVYSFVEDEFDAMIRTGAFDSVEAPRDEAAE
jgi:hypothetical protein